MNSVNYDLFLIWINSKHFKDKKNLYEYIKYEYVPYSTVNEYRKECIWYVL